jgi:hypothetical protein
MTVGNEDAGNVRAHRAAANDNAFGSLHLALLEVLVTIATDAWMITSSNASKRTTT